MPALTHLEINDTPLSDELVIKMRQQLLKANSRLEHLVLEDCSITSAGCNEHAEYLDKISKLSEVSLQYNQIGGIGCSSLSKALSRFPKLCSLSLDSNDLSSADHCALVDGLSACKQLQTISLSDVNIDQDDKQLFLRLFLSHSTTFRAISLHSSSFGSELCCMLDVIALPVLEHLELTGHTILVSEVQCLVDAFPTMQSLQCLNLSQSDLDPGCCVVLSTGFRNLTKLTDLVLDENCLGNTVDASDSSGINALALQVSQLKSLRYLNLEASFVPLEAGSNLITTLGTSPRSATVRLAMYSCNTEKVCQQWRDIVSNKQFVELRL